jgi:hypothetical protein
MASSPKLAFMGKNGQSISSVRMTRIYRQLIEDLCFEGETTAVIRERARP